MSSHISVQGSLYMQDAEGGKTSNIIPFEIYSNYADDPQDNYFSHIRFKNNSYYTDIGLSKGGDFFYMSENSETIFTEQSNTFILTSDGNVGVGKTDPSDRLHVEGTALVRGSAGNFSSASVSNNVHVSNVMIDDGNIVVSGNDKVRIPSGTIALWENASTIPDGWSLFNAIGTRFVRGSTGTGSISGDNMINVNINNFPAHNHTTNNSRIYNSNSNHTHNHNSTVNNSNYSHAHNVNANYNNQNMAHGHYYNIKYNFNTSAGTFFGGNQVWSHGNVNVPITSGGDHFHYYSVGTLAKNTGYAHNHGVNNGVSNNSWYHSTNSYTSVSTGSDSVISIIPPYKSYVFIIKD